MDRFKRKPTLTPPEPASDAGFDDQHERWPAEPKVGGSSPLWRARNRRVTGEVSLMPCHRPAARVGANPLAIR
jgi:hypothetical protein